MLVSDSAAGMGFSTSPGVGMMRARSFTRLQPVQDDATLRFVRGLAWHEWGARAYIYSSRSGCSRTMRAHSGWNWNQPAMCEPICCWVMAALAASILTGVPAASARS